MLEDFKLDGSRRVGLYASALTSSSTNPKLCLLHGSGKALVLGRVLQPPCKYSSSFSSCGLSNLIYGKRTFRATNLMAKPNNRQRQGPDLPWVSVRCCFSFGSFKIGTKSWDEKLHSAECSFSLTQFLYSLGGFQSLKVLAS